MRSIVYHASSAEDSAEISEVFQKVDIGLSVEERYSADKVIRAREAILKLHAASGKPVKVDVATNSISPRGIEVVFRINRSGLAR